MRKSDLKGFQKSDPEKIQTLIKKIKQQLFILNFKNIETNIKFKKERGNCLEGFRTITSYCPKEFRTITSCCTEPHSNVRKCWLAMPLGAGFLHWVLACRTKEKKEVAVANF